MEGFSCLIMISGVVFFYFLCNDNVVLFELVDRMRINKWKKIVNKIVLVEDDDDIDILRIILRKKFFKVKFRYLVKIMVCELDWFVIFCSRCEWFMIWCL